MAVVGAGVAVLPQLLKAPVGEPVGGGVAFGALARRVSSRRNVRGGR